MAEAFIYDAVRTPRGRGKADGSLHEVTASPRRRGARRRPRRATGSTRSLVDDVVLGCVDPVGEAGGDIARAAAIDGRLRQRRAGHPDQPLLRLGTRRGELRGRAGHVRAAGHGDRRRRRIHEPRRHGRLGRRLAGRSAHRDSGLLHAAGRLGRPDRHQIRLLAATTSTPMRSRARSAPPRPGTRAASPARSCRCSDVNGLTILGQDEHMRPSTDMQSLGRSKPSFVHDGRDGRLRRGRHRRRIRRSSASTTCIMPATRPASSTARRPSWSARRRPAPQAG